MHELTKNTKFVVTFEWEESLRMPFIQTIEHEKIMCFHYDGKTFKKPIHYLAFVVGVDDCYGAKEGRIERETVEGNQDSFPGFDTKETVPYKVNEKAYSFERTRQQYDPQANTLFVTMRKKDARKIHYIGADYAKLTQTLFDICVQKNEEERERMNEVLKRWEEETIATYEQEKKKKAYAQLSLFKRLIGGKKLKDEYKIS